MTDHPRSVQVVITAGPREADKALLGLRAALAAAAGGLHTDVFLTLEATDWACRDRFVDGAEPAHDAIDQLQALGATVTVCSACATDRCSENRDTATGATAVATRSGIALLGLTTLMDRLADGVPTITF
jgi:sulfur relay (sulfurtransferase) complex TusBCD TusD component (DsrE family)